MESRRTIQIGLAVVALITGLAAGWRFFAEGGAESLFGERVILTPAAGPVGMSPFLELSGFGGPVDVYLCPDATGPIDDCVQMATEAGSERTRSIAIPAVLPSGQDVSPGRYAVRAGPDADGAYPARGTFDVVPFSVGEPRTPRSFAGLAPGDLVLGDERRVARGAECRPASWLPEGRLAVASTVFDPTTGVTVELPTNASRLLWSPVGDKVALLTGDAKEIRLAGPDASSPVTKVREARGLLSSLTWSSDGDRLAYIAQDDPETRGGPGSPTINILNATTGAITTAGLALDVAWSPSGDVLAISRLGPLIELGDLDGARSTLVEGASGPAWSPDGRFLAYITDGGAVGVVLSDGTRPAELASGACAVSFSPSGHAMALVIRDGDETVLVLRTITTGFDQPSSTG